MLDYRNVRKKRRKKHNIESSIQKWYVVYVFKKKKKKHISQLNQKQPLLRSCEAYELNACLSSALDTLHCYSMTPCCLV